jgi:hypothetical protein
VYVSWSSSSIYGGDSGNRIFVLYWRCLLISVSVIRGSTVLRICSRLCKTDYEVQDHGSITDKGCHCLRLHLVQRSTTEFLCNVKHKKTGNVRKRNTEARLRNNCCCGKALSVTYCLSSMQSVYAILWRNVWPLWLHHIFRHYLTNGAIFGKKLSTLKCVFLFCLQLLSKTFRILRNI